MKKLVFSMCCSLAVVGFAMADEFNATIRKVDGLTVYLTKGKIGDERESMAQAVVDAKVHYGAKGKTGEEPTIGDAIAKGLKNEMFSKIDENGISVQITTDDAGKITQVLVFKGGEKAADKKADKKAGKKKG